MKSLKKLSFTSKNIKSITAVSKLGISWCRMIAICQSGIPNAENVANSRFLHTQRDCLSSTLLEHHGSGYQTISCQSRSSLVKQALWRSGTQLLCQGNSLSMRPSPITLRRFGSSVNGPSLSRDWLMKLWLIDKKKEDSKPRGKQKYRKQVHNNASSFSDEPVQPPLSQSPTGFLKPSSPEEFKVAPLLARSNLLITRDIEWANLMLGFEQENRYAVVDPCYPQGRVGFIAEQSNLIARQILRTRRPFIAYITDAAGNELFRVRRPFWWINSTIFAEIDGKEIGVVHRRWHLWRRVYDLYLGTQQFAVVENPGFWNWTFTLKDNDGNVLAAVDRDWRGFGFELLTDAGQYVIRFGEADTISKTGPASLIEDLKISRPLTLSERAVVVALAVSLDNDYFSRHGGWGIPFFAMEE